MKQTERYYPSYLPIYWALWAIATCAVIAVLAALVVFRQASQSVLFATVSIHFVLLAPLLVMVIGYETDRLIDYVKRTYNKTLPRPLVLQFVFTKQTGRDAVINQLKAMYRRLVVFMWVAFLSFPTLLLIAALL
jgi:hypothetical protein